MLPRGLVSTCSGRALGLGLPGRVSGRRRYSRPDHAGVVERGFGAGFVRAGQGLEEGDAVGERGADVVEGELEQGDAVGVLGGVVAAQDLRAVPGEEDHRGAAGLGDDEG